MNVVVMPKSSRAKNRVKEHGANFRLLDNQGNKILVESLENTWCGEKWLGWFDDNEAEWEVI